MGKFYFGASPSNITHFWFQFLELSNLIQYLSTSEPNPTTTEQLPTNNSENIFVDWRFTSTVAASPD